MRGGIIAAGWGERLGQKQPKALTEVGGKPLIDYVLEGFAAAGVTDVTCIVNEAAGAVPEHVAGSRLRMRMDWIVKTTPSSMHSFLIVLERLAGLPLPMSPGFLIATVDSVCSPQAYAQFVREAQLFPQADVVLGLTNVIDDEKPLRVAMRGSEGTGLMPKTIRENPEAFEIVAMTNNGFESEYVTSGFYYVRPTILKEKQRALDLGFTALRHYLGHLLKFGYRTYGVPLPPVVDVDRPQDIRAAEKLLNVDWIPASAGMTTKP
jgi:NDP-sugar pyrophosphorylase family protein